MILQMTLVAYCNFSGSTLLSQALRYIMAINILAPHLLAIFLSLLFACNAFGFVSELLPYERKAIYRAKVTDLTLYEQPSLKSREKKKRGRRVILLSMTRRDIKTCGVAK